MKEKFYIGNVNEGGAIDWHEIPDVEMVAFVPEVEVRGPAYSADIADTHQEGTLSWTFEVQLQASPLIEFWNEIRQQLPIECEVEDIYESLYGDWSWTSEYDY